VPSEPVSELKTDPEPLSSPFLVDAKVEKRPLGGEAKPESPEEKPEEPKEEAEELAQKVAEIENAPDPTEDTPDDDKSSVMDLMKEPAQSLTEVTEHLPDEFAEELLAVEKNVDDPISEDESGDSDKKSPKDDPKDDAKEDLKDEKTSDDHHKVISIPKQYQEKPSSSDETSGSIFDTKHYHKPVAHPAEQKSGWLWVIVIVVFIAVGALLGAAAYFFGLI
jgi:cobalamin biosynthesis Mg chelatase CobN